MKLVCGILYLIASSLAEARLISPSSHSASSPVSDIRSSGSTISKAGVGTGGSGDSGSWSVVGREEQIVFDASSEPNDGFGCSVASYDDVMVIGAYSARLEGTTIPSGAAYVFRRLDGVWTLEAKVQIQMSTNRDYFGWSVAIFDNVIAVSGYQAYGDKKSVGMVYTYVYDEILAEWLPQKAIGASAVINPGSELKPGSGNNVMPDFDYFAYSIDMHNGTLVAGTYGDDTKGTFAGSVTIVEYYISHAFSDVTNTTQPVTSWALKQTIYASDAEDFNYFGWSVSKHEDVIVVGAYGYSNEYYEYTGAAYVFQPVANNKGVLSWAQTTKLLPPVPASMEYFGWYVSAYANKVAIGAPGTPNGDSSVMGSVFVYTSDVNSPTSWTELSRLYTHVGESSERFGYSVSLHGDLLLVGVVGSESSSTSSGSAMLYSLSVLDDGSVLVQKEVTLRPFSKEISDSRTAKAKGFGSCVHLYGSVIAVGASDSDGATFQTGVVYSYTAGRDYFPVGASTYDFLVYFIPVGFVAMTLTSVVFIKFGEILSERIKGYSSEALDTSSAHDEDDIELTESQTKAILGAHS
jgi:hypothetical protein